MTILVTGGAGHLGEALMRTLPQQGHQVIGLDIKPPAGSSSRFWIEP
jgi:UDP-glucose 4-epimerase